MSLERIPKDNVVKEQGDSYGKRCWEIWPVGEVAGGWKTATKHGGYRLKS